MERKYLKHYMDDDLERYLRMIGAVLIVGPKWCGKTTTAERHAKSVLNYRRISQRSHLLLLSSEPIV